MRLDLEKDVLRLLESHRLMTIATLRPDGWPQATTVGYVNDGLKIYFLCSSGSQKATNLARDDRVSLTIDHDTASPMEIEGLSMAARAVPVTDTEEIGKLLGRIATRFPEYADLPTPDLEEVKVFRLEPRIISVLDYRKGFGHAELIVLSPADMVPPGAPSLALPEVGGGGSWRYVAPWPASPASG